MHDLLLLWSLTLSYLLTSTDLQVVFKTRIFHCNVDSAGNVSLDILNDSWSPALTITKVLLAIRSMFTNPDPCKFFHQFLFTNYAVSVNGWVWGSFTSFYLPTTLFLSNGSVWGAAWGPGSRTCFVNCAFVVIVVTIVIIGLVDGWNFPHWFLKVFHHARKDENLDKFKLRKNN